MHSVLPLLIAPSAIIPSLSFTGLLGHHHVSTCFCFLEKGLNSNPCFLAFSFIAAARFMIPCRTEANLSSKLFIICPHLTRCGIQCIHEVVFCIFIRSIVFELCFQFCKLKVHLPIVNVTFQKFLCCFGSFRQ